jgi:hypothetical protein
MLKVISRQRVLRAVSKHDDFARLRCHWALLQFRHDERQKAADLEQRRAHEREIEQQQPERKRGRRM